MKRPIITGVNTAANLTTSSGVTRFGTFLPGGLSSTDSSTNRSSQFQAPRAGSVSGFALRIASNTRTTSTVFRTYINNLPGTQTFTVPAGATGWFEDATHTEVLAAGDVVQWGYTNGASSTGSILPRIRRIDWEASGGVKSLIWPMAGDVNLENATTTNRRISPMSGSVEASSSNVEISRWKSPAGTWRGLLVNVTSNGRTGPCYMRSFVNGVVGNQVVTIPTGTTGTFEDTTHSDVVAEGDLLNIGIDNSAGGTGSWTWWVGQTEFLPTNDVFVLGGANAVAANFAGTQYVPIVARRTFSAVESDVTLRMSEGGKLSRLFIAINNLSQGTDCSFTIRKNGVDTALSVTLPVGTPTPVYLEDVLHEVTFAAGDDIVLFQNNVTDTAWNFGQIQVTVGPAIANLFVDLGDPAELVLTGQTIEVPVPTEVTLSAPAALTLTGQTIEVPEALEVQLSAPASIDLLGLQPDIDLGTFVNLPAPAVLDLVGHPIRVLVETWTDASQAAAIAVVEVDPDAQASQAAIIAIGEVTAEVEASQVAIIAVTAIEPDLRASQTAVIVFADYEPCVSRNCQLWTIYRRDGEVLRFTSLDVDFWDGDLLYHACSSLDPSASEATAANAAGDIELKGIISSDLVSEDDLLAGLYDDAYVTVWLVPWAGAGSRRRLSAGWVGDMERGDTGFTMSVLGPGARLEQKSLLETVAASCSHELGVGQCQFDIEGAKRGGMVTFGVDRGRFTAIIDELSAGSQDGGLYWENGHVTWLTGRNAGQVTEVKTVDFDTGEIVLWALTGFLPETGDTFSLYPGCPKTLDACKDYDQVLNHGGFPHIPGEDALMETPDAKY